MEAALKAVTGNIHPELNEQFFGSTGRPGGLVLRNPQSSDAFTPKAVTPGTPTPSTSTGNPTQQPVAPK
jgi:hypothetical protein